MRRALVLALLLVGCGEDPCAGIGEPTLELGTTNDIATTFEPFEDGAALPLATGPQIGMHVWLNLRITGLCLPDVSVDRRVVDADTEALIEIQRGPLRWDPDPEIPDAHILDYPLTMILCPNERAIVDQPMRFDVRAEDSLGRSVIERKRFTPVCATGACDTCP